MLHAGGQGDAMLSAININPQDSEAALQVSNYLPSITLFSILCSKIIFIIRFK